LRVWRGGEGIALGRQKYMKKLRNLSHFLKEYLFFLKQKKVFFLESDKLILMINIFLILEIL